jgi:hypothetical protein
MRRFARFVCLGLGAAGALAAAGCTPTGHYQVSWNFFPNADGTGTPESAANACGLHGVDAVFIQGTSGGNGATEIALCTSPGLAPDGTEVWGQVTGTVATGDWTFTIQQMDVRGTRFGATETTATMTVSQGATAVFPTVTLTPRPECSDGVDNDHDGLVDLDDPGCANFDTQNPDDPQNLTLLESSAGPAARLDGGAPDAGGTPDGGMPEGGATDGTAPDGPPADGPDVDGAAADAGQADGGVPDDAAGGG